MAKQTKTYKHHYPSDLTDAQWAVLEPLLALDPDEPARVYAVRDIVDAIFYLNRTGCTWATVDVIVTEIRGLQPEIICWQSR